MDLLAGRREIAEIARFATTPTQPQRRPLGLPLKKGTHAFHELPGYRVFYQVLTRNCSPTSHSFATRCFTSSSTSWRNSRIPSHPLLGPDRQFITSKRKALPLTGAEERFEELLRFSSAAISAEQRARY
jgi:hypothetical protein